MRIFPTSVVLLALLAACGGDTSSQAPATAEAPSVAEPGTESHGVAKEGTPSTEAAEAGGSTFGSDFTVNTVTPVGEVLADPVPHVGKTLRLEGTVVDVCEMRGCWLTLGTDSGDVLRVKVNDGDMVFPLSARGLSAQVEGTIESFELSVEQLRKRAAYTAEEQGETFDPSTITEPETIYMLKPSAVLIAS